MINLKPQLPSVQIINAICQFKYPLWGCISENKYKYFGLISATLWSGFTMHLSDTNSIAQICKYIPVVLLNFDEFLQKNLLDKQDSKQTI